MSLEKNFCSSPWLHMRINHNGDYEYCRWANRTGIPIKNLRTTSPIEWFQQDISNIRKNMLDGQVIEGCSSCHQMEQHQKVSGRQKQLLKVGVRLETFVPSMKSSPWLDAFAASQQTGTTDLMPQDWQIDLGNYCNSACLFCSPTSSSRIAVEHKRLGLIQQMPPSAWCDNPVLLQKFLDVLQSSPRLRYLHFIGGETLITPAFKKILTALVQANLHQTVSIGFTVNLTVWDQSIVDLLTQFKEVNLGMSIECIHPVNDYVRYGGQLLQTQKILDQWIDVGNKHQWLMSIRTTPTVLSVLHLDTIYKYAWDRRLSVESCNFLNNPAFMRPGVLPIKFRQLAIDKLSHFAQKVDNDYQIVNTRDSNNYQLHLIQDATSYINYLTNADDESYRLPDLVTYLKRTEAVRNNCVLDYLPEYEKLFRTAGY